VSVRDDLRDVVTLLVDERERVEIDEQLQGEKNTLVLSVVEDDLGKVIGRQGRTARALRRFLEARGASGRVWDLKILD
jgi:predicted RNA-binding protein YlqC (UPF0109 family)